MPFTPSISDEPVCFRSKTLSVFALSGCALVAGLLTTASPVVAQQASGQGSAVPGLTNGAGGQSAARPGAAILRGSVRPGQGSLDAFPIGAVGQRGGQPNLVGRPIIQDGDLSFPREPEALQDGVLTVPTLAATGSRVTESSPADTDQRSDADVAAFNNPPAGYDPQLFQIDNISPLQDRRTRRLFIQQVEPFDPIGVRVGSFLLFPEIELGANFASNVLNSPDITPDRSVDVLASGRLVSNWTNHALELRGAVNASRFNKFDTENERGFDLEARGRLDVRRSTNLQGLIARTRAQESRSAVDASLVGPRTSVVTDRGQVTLNHRFNRLRVQLRGGLASEGFSDDVDPGTGVAIPGDRDNLSREIAGRASWEFKPTLTVFGEVEGNHRDFKVRAASDGLSRNSAGTRYRTGVSFGQTGAYLRGEVSLGYGRQNLAEDALDDIDGVLFDANLAWRATALTSVLFNANTNFVNSTTAGTGGVLERRYGLELRHAFRPYFVGSAGVGVTSRSFAGIGLDEREVAYNLGLEYTLRREVVLFGTYERTVFRSDFDNSDFENDEVRIGMRLRR